MTQPPPAETAPPSDDDVAAAADATWPPEPEPSEAGAGPADEPEAPPEPEVERPPVRTLVDVLRDQLAEKESKLHEYIAAYKAAKTDMDERVARLERDRQKVIDRDRKQIAGDLLEVLDNLERSSAAIADATSADGVRMVHRQFLKVLTDFGVERVEALGAAFDANLHEAIGMVPAHGDQFDQEVVHVDRAGYRFKGEMLRPANVIVATKG